MYPEGDRSAPPSGRMPKGGFYFDTIVRQEPIDDEKLNVEDNLEEFGPISDADARALSPARPTGSQPSDRAILANFGGTAFGDIALVPGPVAEAPEGHPRRRRVVHEHGHPARLRLRGLRAASARSPWRTWRKIHDAVGDAVTAVFITGTDFGTQHGPVHLARRPTASSSSRSTAA